MRYAILLLLLIAGCALNAQDSLVAISRLEQWVTTPGKLFRSDIVPLGNIGNTQVLFITIRDQSSDSTMEAVKLQDESDNNDHPVNPLAVYIDAHELPTLISHLQQLAGSTDTLAQNLVRVYTYTTSDWVHLSCTRSGTARWFSLGRLTLREKKLYLPSVITFNRRRAQELVALLERGRLSMRTAAR